MCSLKVTKWRWGRGDEKIPGCVLSGSNTVRQVVELGVGGDMITGGVLDVSHTVRKMRRVP